MLDALLTIVAIGIYVLALGTGWLLTLFGLPGTWLIVVSAVLYAWVMPDGSRWDLSWALVGWLAGLAVVGEILETAASAMGVKKLGGSRRGAVFSIVLSIVGALFGSAVIPIPVVGTLVGACTGAMAGAVLGEYSAGRGHGPSWQVGRAAFWGRLYGSLAKIIAACIMVAVGLAGILLR